MTAMASENASPPYLEVRGLVKWFGNDRAVDDISFGIARGKFLTLLGPSGCGKTTTLMSIAGLHGIDAGTIRVGGVTYTSASEGLFLAPEKRDIGMVFQSYAIWPHMTVAQNVAYPLEIRKVERPEIEERVADGDPAGVDAVQTGDAHQRRRFAAAGGAEQGQELALGKAEGNVIHGPVVAEPFHQASDFEVG